MDNEGVVTATPLKVLTGVSKKSVQPPPSSLLPSISSILSDTSSCSPSRFTGVRTRHSGAPDYFFFFFFSRGRQKEKRDPAEGRKERRGPPEARGCLATAFQPLCELSFISMQRGRLESSRKSWLAPAEKDAGRKLLRLKIYTLKKKKKKVF